MFFSGVVSHNLVLKNLDRIIPKKFYYKRCILDIVLSEKYCRKRFIPNITRSKWLVSDEANTQKIIIDRSS